MTDHDGRRVGDSDLGDGPRREFGENGGVGASADHLRAEADAGLVAGRSGHRDPSAAPLGTYDAGAGMLPAPGAAADGTQRPLGAPAGEAQRPPWVAIGIAVVVVLLIAVFWLG